jgi:hypothetical protein
LGKLLGFGKKGYKAASKRKGGKAAEVSWPPGIRVGVFGHTNVGKTVYFTVLNEECKIAKDLQISVTDNATAGEFLANYRSIWGLDTAAETGTVVDRRGEKKFPEPTVKDKYLQFTAILDRRKKIPVVAFDYNGQAVSISERSEQADKVLEFLTACHGILFFFDPKIMGAELEIQARASAFVNLLERIASLKSRIPIPIGLVVTKADTLPGFTGEGQTVLINPEDEQFIADDFDIFLEKVLNSAKIAADSTWAASVRKVLVKLREFLRIVMGRTLNFQIFFISSTGNAPAKIGADIGRSVYAPPDKINPAGVKEPLYWLLNGIRRNRRLNAFRKVAKFAALISIIWILLYSLPFLYHFGLKMPTPINTEDRILHTVDNNHLLTSDNQRIEIRRAYKRYKESWLVRKVFPGYMSAANRMEEIYENFDIGKAIKKLDRLIRDFKGIVADSALWPRLNPGKDSLIYTERHTKLIDELEGLHVGEETSTLYTRSDRTLMLWNLFTQYLKSRNDTSAAVAIQEQVNFDQDNAPNYSDGEESLGKALISAAEIKKKKVVKIDDSQKGLAEYDDIKRRINDSSEPAFILGKAVRELKSIKSRLIEGQHDEQIGAINEFLNEVKKWDRRQEFMLRVETVPDDGHLHIEITEDGKDPSWSNQTQMYEGDTMDIKWKINDDIHIAFDERGYCQWGQQPTDKIVLRDKYGLFELEEPLTFPSTGKTITISIKDGLKDRLPKMR